MRQRLALIRLLNPRLVAFALLFVLRRDAEVVHPLVHLRLLHAAFALVFSGRRLTRLGRRVQTLTELARPYHLDAATPHVVRQSPVRSHDLQRPPLARRLHQLLYARVRVAPPRRVEDPHAHEVSPVGEASPRRPAEHALDRPPPPAREPRQLTQHPPPRARPIPMPP